MHQPELSAKNYRRISWINILIAPPLFVLFAWPYYILGTRIELPGLLLNAGSFCFAFPFTLTIIHGHVTMAIGSLHRNNYYKWLAAHRWSYGLLIRPVFFSTRFRIAFLIISFGFLLSVIML